MQITVLMSEWMLKFLPLFLQSVCLFPLAGIKVKA